MKAVFGILGLLMLIGWTPGALAGEVVYCYETPASVSLKIKKRNTQSCIVNMSGGTVGSKVVISNRASRVVTEGILISKEIRYGVVIVDNKDVEISHNFIATLK